jgi:hypothetical protein
MLRRNNLGSFCPLARIFNREEREGHEVEGRQLRVIFQRTALPAANIPLSYGTRKWPTL